MPALPHCYPQVGCFLGLGSQVCSEMQLKCPGASQTVLSGPQALLTEDGTSLPPTTTPSKGECRSGESLASSRTPAWGQSLLVLGLGTTPWPAQPAIPHS